MTDDPNASTDLESVPTMELWTLLKRFPLPRTASGDPAPGSEDLHAAHASVRAWLARVELELGLPSFENTADWAEYDYDRRQLGLCPRCRRNDGYTLINDEFWGLCHRHRVKWEVPDDAVGGGSFVADTGDVEESPFRPVRKYQVVEPIHVVDAERS